jgi:hypothetical protein
MTPLIASMQIKALVAISMDVKDLRMLTDLQNLKSSHVTNNPGDKNVVISENVKYLRRLASLKQLKLSHLIFQVMRM